jgi:uncharacterized protein YjbI with pentapeptide repeats
MEIRKPLVKKEKLTEATFHASSVIQMDEVTLSGGSADNEEIDEVKISTSIVHSLSFQSSTVEDLSIIDAFLFAANFAGAVFNHTFFERARLSKCRLQGTQLMECIARDTVIEKSKCNDVSFRFAKMENIVFLDCEMENTDFSGAHLKNVLFRNCNLKKSQFSHAKLHHVSLKESDIQGIAIDKDSFGDVIVNTGQALYLASRLGLRIED